MSVYGTDARIAPLRAFLACRLQTTRSGVATFPRTPLSACAYRVERPSTRPLVLCSTVPRRFIALRAGPEFRPAFHRLRLWGLTLGPASPCADCHGAGTLGLTVCGVFTRICAYSFRHPHFWSLQANVSTGPSLLPERSPTPNTCVLRPSFGGPLNPDHSRRIPAGLVSYYALFQGMAASKPTSQLSMQKHILRYTQWSLRGLSCGSGFFPSRRWTLSLSDCLPGYRSMVFGVWLGLVPASPARAHPVALPP